MLGIIFSPLCLDCKNQKHLLTNESICSRKNKTSRKLVYQSVNVRVNVYHLHGHREPNLLRKYVCLKKENDFLECGPVFEQRRAHKLIFDTVIVYSGKSFLSLERLACIF